MQDVVARILVGISHWAVFFVVAFAIAQAAIGDWFFVYTLLGIFGAIIGLITLVVLTGLVVYAVQEWRNGLEDKVKTTPLVVAYYRSFKEKYCPHIEWR